MSIKSTGLSDTVYNHLLDQIFSDQLKPGDKIAEAKVAAEFNTSRTPIREAMRRLEAQGLLKIYPKRYAEVTVFTHKEIEDIGILRISLDLLSVKLAALYGNRADYMHLKEIAEACLDSYHRQDGYRRRKLDSDFHLELCRITKNELLYKMQTDLSLKIQFILLHNEFIVEDEEAHLQQHLTLIDHLLENRVEEAQKVSVQHLSEFYHLDINDPISFFVS